MPFEFCLGRPTEVFFGYEGDYTVDFDLGVDSDTNERVFMQVALYEHEDAPNPFSLLFGIRRQNLDTLHVGGVSFDHATAMAIIPKDQRQITLENVLESVKSLINEVNPSETMMETYESSLNDAAMVKYAIICNTLADMGYTVEVYQRDGTNQRDHWLFTK